MTTKPTLAALREKSEKSAKKAEADKAELLAAAVAEAITSSKYGHLSAVARDAGIASQYLRDLVEEAHPGWLAKAAKEREEAKAGRGKGRGAAAA
ncbi:hypothetical protein [Streptomyces sp. NPDC096153]|uniref:hypothetical protein n=1 Tax=Streptomyces sp. NPDC096153 TaxID=3155548 RepID=UPI00331D9034